MLKIVERGRGDGRACVLLLGGFDGLHAGHETLFTAAQKYHIALGLTSIVGEKTGGDVFTAEERCAVFEKKGADFVYLLPFDGALKSTPAEEFVREILQVFDVRALLCGEDFRFGKGALGTPALLKRLAPCPVEVLPLHRVGGEKVSSTAVKAALSRGDLPAANALLSEPFFLQGVVEHGRRVGRTLGFPTLNLTYPREKFPLKEGVYSGVAQTEAGQFPTVINFGARPTFGVRECKAEAWLKGFSGDLYGSTVRLYPKEFLRPIVKFNSAEELTEQLVRDKEKLV